MRLVVLDGADGVGVHRNRHAGRNLELDHRHDHALVAGRFDQKLYLPPRVEHGDRVVVVEPDYGHPRRLAHCRRDGKPTEIGD